MNKLKIKNKITNLDKNILKIQNSLEIGKAFNLREDCDVISDITHQRGRSSQPVGGLFQ